MAISLKKVAVIINPASGTEYPILAALNTFYRKEKITWQAHVSAQRSDLATFTDKVLQDKPDAVFVYGGDGTVMEVGKKLYQSQIPLGILPGGTANIFARELQLPLDIPQTLERFKKEPETTAVDVWLVNNEPMILRIEAGVVAEIVKKTQRRQKKQLGTLAYPLTALQAVKDIQPIQYLLTIKNEITVEPGVGLMIANVGNIGVPNVSIRPSVSCSDGVLNIFILQSADMQSILSVGLSTFLRTARPETLKHWTVTEAKIEWPELDHHVIMDDTVVKTNSLDITPSTHKLLVLT